MMRTLRFNIISFVESDLVKSIGTPGTILNFLTLNVPRWLTSRDPRQPRLITLKGNHNRGLRRHIVRSRLCLSNYYQFQDTWLIPKLWEHATCKFMRDLCVPLLLPSKTCASHAHSSPASFHPNPPRHPLYNATRLAPPGHFSYHAALCIICSCMHGTVSYGARLIPLGRELPPRRRQGIASKFVVPALSNEPTDI